MTITSKLTAKNQTTIPPAVVAALGIKPSSALVYEIEPDGRVFLSAKSATFEELAETFPKKRPKRRVTADDIQNAVRSGAVKRFKRSRP